MLQHCTENISSGELTPWLRQRKGSRKFYHHDFTGGRLKHKEAKEGQERCKWYVQGHPERLLQNECVNPHFSLHPVPLLSAHSLHSQSCSRVSMVSATVTQRSPHLHRCRRVQINLQLLNPSSRERTSVKWVHTSCSLGSRRQSWQESSVRTTPKSHREEQSVRISWSTPAAEDTGEKEAA